MTARASRILRFMTAAVLAPALAWVVGSAVPNEQPWLNFVVEVAAMLLAVFAVSFVGKSLTGWAVSVGFGLTFGLASALVLYFGARGINACGKHAAATFACPSPPVGAALGILVEIAIAVAFAFWLSWRWDRREHISGTTVAIPGRPDGVPG